MKQHLLVHSITVNIEVVLKGLEVAEGKKVLVIGWERRCDGGWYSSGHHEGEDKSDLKNEERKEKN